MTVQSEFVSWQTNPKRPDPKECSPICGAWWRHLFATWGGQFLGCYVNRPIVGGTSLSSHASGAALDWRYQNPGCGRSVMLAETMPWLLNNSRELGIQALHDYSGKRIWRPPSCSGRPAQPSPECGWRPSSGGQMHVANLWLHLEVLPSRWSDTRTVAQMLETVTPPEPPEPPKPPTTGVFIVPDAYRKLVVAGSDGKMAKLCQQQINLISGAGISEDGFFGYQSVGALQNLQRFFGLPDDGKCGPATWTAFEQAIKVQAEAGDWD
jgi:hypothetical protein